MESDFLPNLIEKKISRKIEILRSEFWSVIKAKILEFKQVETKKSEQNSMLTGK